MNALADSAFWAWPVPVSCDNATSTKSAAGSELRIYRGEDRTKDRIQSLGKLDFGAFQKFYAPFALSRRICTGFWNETELFHPRNGTTQKENCAPLVEMRGYSMVGCNTCGPFFSCKLAMGAR